MLAKLIVSPRYGPTPPHSLNGVSGAIGRRRRELPDNAPDHASGTSRKSDCFRILGETEPEIGARFATGDASRDKVIAKCVDLEERLELVRPLLLRHLELDVPNAFVTAADFQVDKVALRDDGWPKILI